MRQAVNFVQHTKGFFLAVNNDINHRLVIIEGFSKGLSNLNQYKKLCKRTFTSYDYQSKDIITDKDLSKRDLSLSIDDFFDPGKVDITTGEDLTYKSTAISSIVGSLKANHNTLTTDEAKGVASTVVTEDIPQTIVTKTVNKVNTKTAATAVAPKSNNGVATSLDARFYRADGSLRVSQKALRLAKKEGHKAIALGIDILLNPKAVAPAPPRKKVVKKTVKKEPVMTQAEMIAAAVTAAIKATKDAEPEVAEVIKEDSPRPIRRGLARAAEVAIAVPFNAGISTLVGISDMVYLGAECLAWGKSTMIKPLGLHPDMTRRQMKELTMKQVDARHAVVYNAPKALVNLTKAKIAVGKEKLQARKEIAKMNASLNNIQPV